MSTVLGTIKEKTSAVDFFTAKLAYETTPHDVARDQSKGTVYVVDVRDRQSYEDEHIPGAKNIPLDELTKNLAGLPKDKTIVTYCWNITCFAAPRAALELAQKGYKVQEMIGGIDEWKKRGLEVEGNKQ